MQTDESAERACFVFDVSFAPMLTRFLNRVIFLMRSQNCWNGVQSLKEMEANNEGWAFLASLKISKLRAINGP